MYIYILLVFLITITYFLLFFTKIRYKYLFLISFSFVLLFIVSGFRGATVGADTVTYIRTFNSVNSQSLSASLNTYFEPGFILYNYLLGLFFEDPQYYLMISSLLILTSIGYFIYKNSFSPFISIFIFITFMFFYDSMNIIRQYLALSIILAGYSYVKEKKFVKYTLLVLLATSFHTTAVVSILIYFFYHVKFSYKKIGILFGLTLISYFFLTPILNVVFSILPRYLSYESRLGSYNLASYMSAIIYILILLFGLIVISREKKAEIKISSIRKSYDSLIIERINNIEKMSITIAAAAAFSILSIKINVLGRVDLYFSIFSIIYIANVLFIVKNTYLRVYITILLLLLFSLYNLIVFMLRPEWYRVIPYEFFI